MRHLNGIEEFRELSSKVGGLLSVCAAARAAGVSRQRLYLLLARGRFFAWAWDGSVYVSGDEVAAYRHQRAKRELASASPSNLV